MEKAVHWKRLLKLIEPHEPKAGKDRSPMPMEDVTYLFSSTGYALSGSVAEDAFYDNEVCVTLQG